MKPHLAYAHTLWKHTIQPGDLVIDATVGNGKDTFFLAQLLQGKGSLIGYDIQPQALDSTKNLLKTLPASFNQNIHLKLKSHLYLEEKNAKLIVYNLGYLPGGDKKVTTLTESTLQSVQSALHCLTKEGALSIVCYPGHSEGKKEEKVLLEFLSSLSSKLWQICYHQWINRPLAPSLIWLQALPDA